MGPAVAAGGVRGRLGRRQHRLPACLPTAREAARAVPAGPGGTAAGVCVRLVSPAWQIQIAASLCPPAMD